MTVIGVDVHKRSLTAVAVDEVGREVGEQTTVDGAGLLVWSGKLPGERLWAVEDCRQLTRGLERDLVAAGERGAGDRSGASRCSHSRTLSAHSPTTDSGTAARDGAALAREAFATGHLPSTSRLVPSAGSKKCARSTSIASSSRSPGTGCVRGSRRATNEPPRAASGSPAMLSALTSSMRK